MAPIVRGGGRAIRPIDPGRTIAAPQSGRRMRGVAAGAGGWCHPSGGAGLAKLQLWAPDVGQAIGIVVVLSAALALTRLGMGVNALAGAGR